jgi:dethiobiotin synthetase
MTRIVVLGTGTDVGKTFISASLTRALSVDPRTASASAIKPIESGLSHATSADHHATDFKHQLPRPHGPSLDPVSASDAELLAKASVPNFQPPPHAYAYSEPLSPHLAAKRARESIEIGATIHWISRIESQRSSRQDGTPVRPARSITNAAPSDPSRDWTIVETAGAAFTPLAVGITNASLAQALEPAIWILVAPDRLGVLHDLTTTLHAMRSISREPDCVVLSQLHHRDKSTGTNAAELKSLDIATVDAVVECNGHVSQAFIHHIYNIAENRGL